MKTNDIIIKLKTFLIGKLGDISSDSGLLYIFKPVIARIINNSTLKLNSTLSLLEDSEGNIDIENLMSEIVSNIISSSPQTVRIENIGNIEIGGGEIKLDIPFTNKKLILNNNDLLDLKNMFIENRI